MVSLVIDLASITTAFVHPSISNNDKQKIRNGIAGLDCDKKPDEIVTIDDNDPPTTVFGAARRGGYNGIGSLRRSVKRMQRMQSKPNRDPSGYVYEGVSSNRLEGVTATCYYKEEVEDMYGDLYERAVVWDAENYEQVNPQTTDVEGKYGWDVARAAATVGRQRRYDAVATARGCSCGRLQERRRGGVRQVHEPSDTEQNQHPCHQGRPEY